MEAEIRKLSKRQNGEDMDDEPQKKKTKKSYLEEELAKYAKGRGTRRKDKRKDESGVLAALSSFRSKLQSSMADDAEEMGEKINTTKDDAKPVPAESDPGIEVDDDQGFLSHHLEFPKDNSEEVRKAERDYEVIDPRQRGAKAREEERERKKAMKNKFGGRGYRR